jgi:hypothetical protein
MENIGFTSNDSNEYEDSIKTQSTNDIFENIISESNYIREDKLKKLNILLKKEKTILLNRNNLKKKEFNEVKDGIELISHNLNNFFSLKLKKYNKKYD